ncbi:MAG TPA: two-component regulator propeller domain-containing protein [Pyrinomonadaceae bacterium]|nr:two-component regulator propeller domain-containing protein [Pyrinomonadaceae bacterium]
MKSQRRNRFHLTQPQQLRILALITLILCSSRYFATERLQRTFGPSSGLIVSTIFSLAQDTEGFIWIGTAGGLVRYDGDQMRPWAKNVINRDVTTLSVSKTGSIVVAEGSGTLYEVTADSVRIVPGPDGNPITDTRDAAFDDAGRLWVLTYSHILSFRDAKGEWNSIGAETFPGQRVHRIRAASDHRMFVFTNKTLWRMKAGEKPERVLEVPVPFDVVEHPSGSLFVLTWAEKVEVLEVHNGQATSRYQAKHRPIDLALRGNVVWLSTSHTLTALREGQPPDEIGPEHDLPSGGPLLVDHEGSLWLGTFAGLIQYPEPETIVWNHKDGMPSSHTRSLAQTNEGVWVATWGGLARMVREQNVWQVRDEKTQSSRPCVISGETLLFTSRDALVMRRRDGSSKLGLPDGVGAHTCAPASLGGAWLATAHGLFRYDENNLTTEVVPSPLLKNGKRTGVLYVFEDRQQRLWAATYEGQICHVPVSSLGSDREIEWSCQMIRNPVDILHIVELPNGTLWMSTNTDGMWRLVGDRWEKIPASRNLASQIVFNLTPSSSGGIWIVGQGTAMRVLERADLPDGWEVVEVLSTWEGLPGSETTDLVEQADGRLWLSTPLGVVSVPPEARRAEATAPRVKLVDVVVNGRVVSGDESAELPNGSQVELHFAALSYRDRGRLRYQYRLRSDADWIDSRDSAPVLRFVDLSAGNYAAEVRASLDGRNWTSDPARLAFTVLKPWYLRPVALALFAFFAAGALYAIYRARIGVLMRLERQRTQIAMDLHDEMGSGLGSIGILSGIAAQEDVAGVERKDLAKKIAATAGELGNSLTEIVWTLKPGATTLDALAYHVAERGGRLFPNGERSFSTDLPASWPRVELTLAVRRNVLLIASEALHNAARHSQATRVIFGLAPDRGRRWRMWINDDGSGIEAPAHSPGSGVGLVSMKRRAEEIGAEISWGTNGSKGTSVTLVFDPRAKEKRSD